MSSLDNFLTKSGEISPEEKEKFAKWISKVLEDPKQISDSIEGALKDGMYSEWEEESINHKFRLGSYYPSIIERCLRQQAYSYLHALPPTSEDLAIFNEGKAIHELVAFAMRRSGLISVEGREVVIDLQFGEAKLHGRIDDLLLIRLGEADDHLRLFVPLEIKSTSTLPDEPKRSHYYQLMTYLLAEDYPLGVLLYWVKREGKIKAFSVKKDEEMRSVLRERVTVLHEALKIGSLPKKEASQAKAYGQCERCGYADRCNPYLIDDIPQGSKISLFDLEGTILDSSARKKAILKELGLPPSARQSDIYDEEMKTRYWNLIDDPRFVQLDTLYDSAKEKILAEKKSGSTPIAISSARHEVLREATKARFANLGVPIFHIILREDGNYDTDGKFKTKWAKRLASNYDLQGFFDRDAILTTSIMNTVIKTNQT